MGPAAREKGLKISLIAVVLWYFLPRKQ